MKRLLIIGALALLAACTTTAPTAGSNAPAPQSQVNAVTAWDAACSTLNTAMSAVLTAEANGIITQADVKNAASIADTVAPLCTSFPTNATAVITQIATAVVQLTAIATQQPGGH